MISLDVIDAIRSAIDYIKSGVVDKVEGKGWKVYRVGLIIRIDLDEKKLDY
jgi:hypothetical protein